MNEKTSEIVRHEAKLHRARTKIKGRPDEWDMYTGYTPAGCGQNITDHWQWCGPANSNPPAPNPGITFGTLIGWVHTASTQINGYTNPPTPMPNYFAIYP